MTYRDNLIAAYFIIANTAETLFNFGMGFSMLDELKDLKGYVEDGERLPSDILDTMQDPLVLQISALIKDIHEIMASLDNLNNFTDAELTGVTPEASPEDIEFEVVEKTRKILLHGLIGYYDSDVIMAQLYLTQLCFANGYIDYDADTCVVNVYEPLKFNDKNVDLIVRFCHRTDELLDYIEANEDYAPAMI